MLDTLFQLGIFSAKAIIIVLLIFLLIAGIIALLGRGKEKSPGKISIKNLNKKFDDIVKSFQEEILQKKDFKKFVKEQKSNEKKIKQTTPQKNIYVLNFHGDMKGTSVASLREEVTAVLGVAKPTDEVVVKLDSGGGMVHAYGLGAAQLQRIRQQQIPLTVIVDKIAASGGYLMASVANKILAAPFSIIGSIGVIVQIPNFHRLLKEKHVDFEQLTAGAYKRTLTMFGQNTEEGREKLQDEIEDIHKLFKQAILQNRSQIDINKVSTGEHWLGTQALELNLVDGLMTSDDYLLKQSKAANIYEVNYQLKKSLAEKLGLAASSIKNHIFTESVIKM